MDETTFDLQRGKYKKAQINLGDVHLYGLTWHHLAQHLASSTDIIRCLRHLIECSKFSAKFTQSHGTRVPIDMDRLICNTRSLRQASCLRDLWLLRDLQLGRLKRITLFPGRILRGLPRPAPLCESQTVTRTFYHDIFIVRM